MILLPLSTTTTVSATILLGFLFAAASCGIPRPEQFFDKQIVDHFSRDEDQQDDQNYSLQQRKKRYWSQRYYTLEKHFQGPGHPIFMILGGEGAISPQTGIFYPFIGDTLSSLWGAFVVQPEHRFYGKSQPINVTREQQQQQRLEDYGEDPRVQLFTPEQALHDAMTLLDHIRIHQLGCSTDRTSTEYCPVITVGGSYPGWLSAMARIMFPNMVDMAYAASAPMGFYAQQVDRFAYYNHITKVAEMTVPSCAAAVRTALQDVELEILTSNSSDDLGAASIGVCPGTIPDYIFHDDDANVKMAIEVMMVIGYTFANDNMAEYPPSTTTSLYKACQIFTSDKGLSSADKVKQFLVQRLGRRRKDEVSKHQTDCWEMTRQLPTGPHATISSGDWSGVGTGDNGESWDFQTCTLLVEAIGFSLDSMFVPRQWSLEWLTRHCQSRFGVTPQPYQIVDRWHFDDLVASNVSHILFTNGLKDGWSVSGIQTNLSETLLALNFPNGAHHSDLSHLGPNKNDTSDIVHGHKMITSILALWLEELQTTRRATTDSLVT